MLSVEWEGKAVFSSNHFKKLDKLELLICQCLKIVSMSSRVNHLLYNLCISAMCIATDFCTSVLHDEKMLECSLK